MNRNLPIVTTALAAAALACAACGGTTPEVEPPGCAKLSAGDLVITEVMANPTSTDTGNEWFEVHNKTAAAVDLKGTTIAIAKAGGEDEKVHSVATGSIAAGGYFTFGDHRDGDRPAWLDYTYENRLRTLGNSSGVIRVLCQGAVIDAFEYSSSKSGVSLALDGRMSPDATANDDETKWCSASSEVSEGLLGTPGATNDNCEGVVDPNNCNDSVTGTSRAITKPVAGDLVITEFMANPAAVDDSKGEWIELLATADVDLNGLEVKNDGTGNTTIGGEDCISVTTGGYVLLVRTLDIETNGGVAGGVAELKTSLSNSGDRAIILMSGDTEIDKVTYTAALVSSGVSAQLDPAKLTAVDNDDNANWCASTTLLTSGDRGSPGFANENCPQ